MRFFALRRATDLEYLEACLRNSLSSAAEGMSCVTKGEGVPSSLGPDGALCASERTGASDAGSVLGTAVAFVMTGTS